MREDMEKTRKVADLKNGLWRSAMESMEFVGELWITVWRMLCGRKRLRASEFWFFVQEVGYNSVPIVSLMSFLIGLIMAFVGAVQLSQVGASIFVANLVSLAMVREMGAMMTGIIIAGRSGAAFAASLASMKMNEEVDALRAFGLDPMEVLVIPRVFALIVMMPCLCILSDLVGILGGFFVGVSLLKLSVYEYFMQTKQALTFTSCSIGVMKSVIFGFLIGFFACLRGLRSENRAEAVGLAATRTVVLSIVGLVVVDALFAFILNILGL